jgi:hypothetical protein
LRGVSPAAIAADGRFDDRGRVKHELAILALAALLLGCAGDRRGAVAPARAGTSAPALPSNEQIRNAYSSFRYHALCRRVHPCLARWREAPWIGWASLGECQPVRRPGRLRCEFIVPESTGLNSENLHRCEGLFRRRGTGWRILAVISPCFGLPGRA